MKRTGAIRKGTRILSAVLTGALLLALPASAGGTERTTEAPPSASRAADDRQNGLEESYRRVAAAYTLPAYSGGQVRHDASAALVPADAALLADAPAGYGVEQAVHIAQGEEASFRLSVPEDGLYILELDYYDGTDSILPVKLGMQIDGIYPFYEMRNQLFESRWTFPEGDFATDRYGNEVVPESVKLREWNTNPLRDAGGLTAGPLQLQLTAGEHLLRLHCEQGALYIGALTLAAMPAWTAQDTGTPTGNAIRIIEAERPAYKSDSTIRPAGEYNLDLTPYSSDHTVLNMLDEGSFSSGGQRVSYTFTVPESGYYYVGFRYRQSAKPDFPAFRDILVDGAAPTDAFRSAVFPYAKSFRNMTVGGDEPVGIYLEAGKEHTLTLAVNLERMAPVADDISRLIAEVQDLSMEILKITGNNVEKYRDFELEEYIEDLPGRLTGWADELRELYEELRTFTAGKKKIGEFASLLVCEKQLRSLAKRPNDLPERLNELSQGQNSVGQYLANVLEKLYASPLALDRIFLYQDEADLPDNAGFFRRLFETVRRFFYSFTPGAYDATAGKKSENSLQVWVNRSRQYVEILQEMADGAFTRETGFTVDLSLMPDQGKLVLANAAGNAPDVALGVNYATPFDLAIRGALKNLKEYPGWQEVASRFKSGLLYPGMVEDGLYSLPETTNFLVLFYRTDILGQLGLSVPDTMEEVKQMLPQLRRRGMDFHSHVAGYIGYKPFAATLPFLYQMGGRYYGDTALDIALDSDASLDAITEMIELFTIYDIPYETPNFYQHFRSGLLPIGVGDFGTYTLLLNTAPEIANSWDIALYPGYADETGRVQRWTTGAAESCIIFNDTEMPEESWEFLRWWTDADTQRRFAETLQLSYGKEYMWNTANVEAFSQLPWNERHKAVILEQMDWIVEAPRVPGNYMMERELSNAFNAIVLNRENPRAAVGEAIKIIRKETERKLEEFGYRKNGETVKDYRIPDIRSLLPAS